MTFQAARQFLCIYAPIILTKLHCVVDEAGMYNDSNRALTVGLVEFENAVKMGQKLAGTDSLKTNCGARIS